MSSIITAAVSLSDRPGRVRSSARTPRLLLFALVASIMMIATSAQAIYVDFADYQGAEVGNETTIEVDGHSISISANPTRYDLSITDSGLGVACTDRRRNCRGNSSSQIDAEWRESIVITFNDGPVELTAVDLSSLYGGEVAVVQAEDFGVSVRGRGWSRRHSDRRVDFDELVTDQIIVSTWGWFSDASLQGIEFNAISGVDANVPIDQDPPISPVPEPGAALLFVAGLGAVGSVSRRR